MNVHERQDAARPQDLARFAATLEVPAPTATVPPLWHWTLFLDQTPRSQLGPDGHPRALGELPATPHPRRMFAGGRLRWGAPLPVGAPIVRRTTFGEVAHKQGRSGPLAFVTVTHRFTVDGELHLEEEQDLVYRPHPPAGTPAVTLPAGDEPIPAAPWQRTLDTDPILLFRFSALTFNAHRIHYDLDHARDTEGYPGLVVHGPMLAVCLAELVRAEVGDDAIRGFEFRAAAPAFCGEQVHLLGWPQDGEVRLAAWGVGRELMTARASLADGVHPAVAGSTGSDAA